MIDKQQVIYRPGSMLAHREERFDQYQVNLERGPLVSEYLALVREHFDGVADSTPTLISYHFRLKLPDIGTLLMETIAERWFSKFLRHIDDVVRMQSKHNSHWRVMKDNGIRCFWSHDCKYDGPNDVRVYLLAQGDKKPTGACQNLLRMEIDKSLRVLVNQSTKELFDGEELLHVEAIIPTNSALDVVSTADDNHQHLKELLFYNMSLLALKPQHLTKDDLAYVSVLTSPFKCETKSGSKNLKVMYSSAKTGEKKQDKWQTPPEIFRQLNDEFHFTLDAAAEAETALCGTYFTEEDDALKQNWGEHIVFCNPPYSKLRAFAKKAYEESRRGATVVMLVPARTDTKAFHEYLSKGEVRFIKGRLKFLQNGLEQDAAPFPSMVSVLGDDVDKKMGIVKQASLHNTIM